MTSSQERTSAESERSRRTAPGTSLMGSQGGAKQPISVLRAGPLLRRCVVMFHVRHTRAPCVSPHHHTTLRAITITPHSRNTQSHTTMPHTYSSSMRSLMIIEYDGCSAHGPTNPSLSAIAIARSKSTAGLVCKHGSKCAACCENAKGPCSPAQSCSRAVPTHARAYSQHTPGPALSGRCHNA